jgi:enoyl-CoA hydratase
MTDTAAVEILADVHRGVGRILLNRAKALNALTTPASFRAISSFATQ